MVLELGARRRDLAGRRRARLLAWPPSARGLPRDGRGARAARRAARRTAGGSAEINQCAPALEVLFTILAASTQRESAWRPRTRRLRLTTAQAGGLRGADVLGADGAAVATCRPQRWVGASVRFGAGGRSLETGDDARALLLHLTPSRPGPRRRVEKPKRRDSLTAREGLVAAIISAAARRIDAQSLGVDFPCPARRCFKNARAPRASGGRRRRKAAGVIFLPRELGVARSGGARSARLLSLGCRRSLALLDAGARASAPAQGNLGGRRLSHAGARRPRRLRARRARVPDRGLGLVGRRRGVAVLRRNTTPRSRAASSMDRTQTFGGRGCVEINQCVGCEDDAMIQHEHAVKFDFRTGCGGAGRHGRRVFGAVARRAGRHRAPRRERARARRRHARRRRRVARAPAVPRRRASIHQSAPFGRVEATPCSAPSTRSALARAYGGSRVIADVEGTHSSPRNRRALDYCGAFLREHLHLGAAPPAGRDLDLAAPPDAPRGG